MIIAQILMALRPKRVKLLATDACIMIGSPKRRRSRVHASKARTTLYDGSWAMLRISSFYHSVQKIVRGSPINGKARSAVAPELKACQVLR
ncbi:hypothetical protein AAE478_009998 [Parahypoxylon ruwenzoriense]